MGIESPPLVLVNHPAVHPQPAPASCCLVYRSAFRPQPRSLVLPSLGSCATTWLWPCWHTASSLRHRNSCHHCSSINTVADFNLVLHLSPCTNLDWFFYLSLYSLCTLIPILPSVPKLAQRVQGGRCLTEEPGVELRKLGFFGGMQKYKDTMQ